MAHIIGSDGASTANPLVMLAQALEVINASLVVIAANTSPKTEHVYEIVTGAEPGMWLSYCRSCSDESQQYIHPCRLAGKAIPPPMFGVSREDHERLQEMAERGEH